MSDSLSNFTLQRSDAGPSGPWTNSSTLPPTATSGTDNTDIVGMMWYQVTQTTVSGVAVPYPVVSISVLPMGTLRASPDPNDPTSLIFTWDVPDNLPLPISRFELTGKFLGDPQDQATLLDVFAAGVRSGRAAVVATDNLFNPYTYTLTGIIDRA